MSVFSSGSAKEIPARSVALRSLLKAYLGNI
jgi:hypothetical protein